MICFLNKRLNFQILVFIVSCLHKSNCGINNESDIDQCISNGGIVDKYKLARYIVSIQINIKQDKPQYFGWYHYCGGAIIGPTKILTAAHCLFQSDGEPLSPRHIVVGVGLINRFIPNKYSSIKNVSQIVPHDYFGKTKDSNKYDIGYLILGEAITFDSPMVGVIDLPDKRLQAGQLCTVLGWGTLFYNGPLAAQLAYAEVQIFSIRECVRIYRYQFTAGMICAADSANWRKDACQGDSGGPLICENKLAGIVSWGVECGMENYPGVYTDVYAYRDWVDASGQRQDANCVIILILFFMQINIF